MSETELNVYLEAIERELKMAVTPREEAYTDLYHMMAYHLGWRDASLQPCEVPRGKRLRPLMCVLACSAVGGEWQRSLPAAAALELIHNFSLIHDDIEDDSLERHHRPTVWALWGIAQGINTGDAMWTLARLAVYRLLERGYTEEQVLGAMRLLDETCLLLCQGQFLDLCFEQDARITIDDYERMIRGKTAALLSASLAIGALLGGAPAELVDIYAAVGRELGLAYQIIDDILGIWGNPQETGKSAASDILARKKTLPIVHAMEWETQHGFADLEHLYAQPNLTKVDVDRILELLKRADTQVYARQVATRHHQRMIQHLDRIPLRPPAYWLLRNLLTKLLDRSY